MIKDYQRMHTLLYFNNIKINKFSEEMEEI